MKTTKMLLLESALTQAQQMVANAENSIVNVSKNKKTLHKAKKEAVEKALKETKIDIIREKKESELAEDMPCSDNNKSNLYKKKGFVPKQNLFPVPQASAAKILKKKVA
jgi:hypothetical protein